MNSFLPRQKDQEEYEYFAQSVQQKPEQCQLCAGTAIEPIVNHALYQKYSSSQDFFYTKEINQIVDQVEKGVYTPAVALFKQYAYWDDDHEEMRRYYQQHQYNNKINMISEYYKFHRDVPMVYEKSVERLMEKYYGRVKQYDYKRIKKVLKDEQGISLTTQKSESSFDQDNSSFIKKSRYSTMLHGLKSQQSRDQSRILMEICDRIEKKIPTKVSHNDAGFHIKGNFETGSKDFESFLQKERMKKKRVQAPTLMKNKINHEQIQLGFSKQIERGFKKPLPQRNFLKKSIEKTTANDTISREQKNKKLQKANFREPYISNKKLVFNQKSTHGQNKMFRPLTSNIIAMKSNTKIKTVDQIYKKSIPINNNYLQKYQTDKSRKSITTFGSSTKKILRNSEFKSSSKKIVSYASKQLRPQFKTIELGQQVQRLPSRDRLHSHNIRNNIQYENQLSDKHRQTKQLARNNSRKSISLGKNKLKAQVERQREIIKRKSTSNLQTQKLRAFSSKQLDIKERRNTHIQPKGKAISRYQSTDLRTKHAAIQKALQNKLGDPRMYTNKI